MTAPEDLYGRNLFGEPVTVAPRGKVADKFILPPFTVLNAREGFWQDRKRAWLARGIEGEVGRDSELLGFSTATEAFRDRRRAGAVGRGDTLLLPAGPLTEPGLNHYRNKTKIEERAALGRDGATPPGGGGGGCWLGGRVTESSAKWRLGAGRAGAFGGGANSKASLAGQKLPVGRGAFNGGLAGKLAPAPVGRDGGLAYNTTDWMLEHGMKTQNGTSIFDPVLCELAYRWFCPPGGTVVDPFAGGPVRGIVATLLGRRYWGCDLRTEQITANEVQASGIVGGTAYYPPEALTPVEYAEEPCIAVWLKRDDRCAVGDMRGGKVRTCWALARGARGLVTAGSRHSPQVAIVAEIARVLGIPCRAHVPSGALGDVVEWAAARGAEIVQHKPGYNTVIIKRAADDAAERGWTLIPFGMECAEAVTQTQVQCANIPPDVTRLVVPVGSGMSLAGILHGTPDGPPVLGVVVGADPAARLDEYAPAGWRDRVTLVKSSRGYEEAVTGAFGGVDLDPHYEAKCLPYLAPGDLLWCVGHRDRVTRPPDRPVWACGDSRVMLAGAPDADFIFSCPPYGDLEVYSDDPADLSAMTYEAFRGAYRQIVAAAAARLKPDRFACFVVGDFRGPDGTYRNFVAETVDAFAAAGCRLYNEAVLITMVGSLPIRITKQFEASRKLGKTHQNVLVFVKGDPRRAAALCEVLEAAEALPDTSAAGATAEAVAAAYRDAADVLIERAVDPPDPEEPEMEPTATEGIIRDAAPDPVEPEQLGLFG